MWTNQENKNVMECYFLSEPKKAHAEFMAAKLYVLGYQNKD